MGEPWLIIMPNATFTVVAGGLVEWEKVALGGEGQGLYISRPGSTTLARYRVGKEAAIITHPYGNGMTVANAIDRFFGQAYCE